MAARVSRRGCWQEKSHVCSWWCSASHPRLLEETTPSAKPVSIPSVVLVRCWEVCLPFPTLQVVFRQVQAPLCASVSPLISQELCYLSHK